MSYDLDASDLAQAWIDEISVNDGILDPEREFRYADLLDSYISSDPKFAWSVIKVISSSNMSEWASENFSSGPLTTFIDRHGKIFYHQVMELLKLDVNFRKQLGGVVFLDEACKLFGDFLNI